VTVDLVGAVAKLRAVPGWDAEERGQELEEQGFEDLWLPLSAVTALVEQWQRFLVPGGQARIMAGPRTGEVGRIVAIWSEGCCTSVLVVLDPGREGLYRIDEVEVLEED